MNLDFTELFKNLPSQLKIEVSIEALKEFGFYIAESTATEILAHKNLPENPISEKDACKRHKKSRQTMAKYRREGKIRYHRFGREIWYFPSELNEDLKNF